MLMGTGRGEDGYLPYSNCTSHRLCLFILRAGICHCFSETPTVTAVWGVELREGHRHFTFQALLGG